MANSPSSKKRARQTERRTEVNKARRSRIRTYIRKVEEAIASGDKTAAAEALRIAQPEIMRGVTKGVTHKNTASRKVSRLAHRVQTLGACRLSQPDSERMAGVPARSGTPSHGQGFRRVDVPASVRLPVFHASVILLSSLNESVCPNTRIAPLRNAANEIACALKRSGIWCARTNNE